MYIYSKLYTLYVYSMLVYIYPFLFIINAYGFTLSPFSFTPFHLLIADFVYHNKGDLSVEK